MTTEEADEVNAIVASRPLDIVLRPVLRGTAIGLHGEFDGYGDYFEIAAHDVEYIDMSGTFPLDALRIVPVDEVARYANKWRDISTEFSGVALIVWSADASAPIEVEARRVYVIVAAQISLHRGVDWPAAR